MSDPEPIEEVVVQVSELVLHRSALSLAAAYGVQQAEKEIYGP